MHIKFQISTLLESGPTPGFSRVSSKRHPWSLRGHCWFLRGVLAVFGIMVAPRIHQRSYISIFRSLPSLKVVQLLCVCRASSWSLRGCWWFLRGVLVVFDIMDAPRIHQATHKFLDLYPPRKWSNSCVLQSVFQL